MEIANHVTVIVSDRAFVMGVPEEIIHNDKISVKYRQKYLVLLLLTCVQRQYRFTLAQYTCFFFDVRCVRTIHKIMEQYTISNMYEISMVMSVRVLILFITTCFSGSVLCPTCASFFFEHYCNGARKRSHAALCECPFVRASIVIRRHSC